MTFYGGKEPQDQFRDIVAEPFEMPVQYQGTPEDIIIEHLYRIANFSERAREQAAPDIIDLSPGSGSQVANTYSAKTGLRVLGILFSGGSGDKFHIKVGGRPYTFFAGNGGPTFFPLPISVSRGQDLSAADVTNPTSTLWACLVYAYPE